MRPRINTGIGTQGWVGSIFHGPCATCQALLLMENNDIYLSDVKRG